MEAEAILIPPPPNEISQMIKKLSDEWNSGFDNLTASTNTKKLEAMALFHSKLLKIHPFGDGNGRMARGILMQQCIDLFGSADMTLMDRGVRYFQALNQADNGELEPLVSIIKPIVGS